MDALLRAPSAPGAAPKTESDQDLASNSSAAKAAGGEALLADTLIAFGLAVMDALIQAPESSTAFAHARRFAAALVAAVVPSRTRFRALRTRLVPDADPRQRALRVALVAVGLGQQRGLAPRTLLELAEASLCLDLGHTLVPEGSAPEVRRTHPLLSVDLLAGHGGLGPVARAAVAGHHERLDGSGAPLGLAGDAVPLPARILGLCVAFVAATTPPAVGPPRPPYVALARLRGPGFDARLFAELEALLARRDAAWTSPPEGPRSAARAG